MEALGWDAARTVEVTDTASGLRAFIVLDDLTLGPAAGGVRTLPYPSAEHALADASSLARAMTIKCALSGLAAGGGKAVVMDHPGLRRREAFEALGAYIEGMGGDFRTAGDAGTGASDLEAMARRCRFVHTEETNLAQAVAEGAIACMNVLRGRLELGTWSGMHVGIQGCGAIGGALARGLARLGARLTVADVREDRVRAVVAETGCRATSTTEILTSDVDILAPCALGGVIHQGVAHQIRARAVCGAANNLMADVAAEEILLSRGIWTVPDVIASAGAVIDGIGRTVMGLEDRAPLIQALGDTTEHILSESQRSGRVPSLVAAAHAASRIHAARDKSAQEKIPC